MANNTGTTQDTFQTKETLAPVPQTNLAMSPVPLLTNKDKTIEITQNSQIFPITQTSQITKRDLLDRVTLLEVRLESLVIKVEELKHVCRTLSEENSRLKEIFAQRATSNQTPVHGTPSIPPPPDFHYSNNFLAFSDHSPFLYK